MTAAAAASQNLQYEGYQDGISTPAVMALWCQSSQIVSTIVIYWNYFNKNTLASREASDDGNDVDGAGMANCHLIHALRLCMQVLNTVDGKIMTKIHP